MQQPVEIGIAEKGPDDAGKMPPEFLHRIDIESKQPVEFPERFRRVALGKRQQQPFLTSEIIAHQRHIHFRPRRDFGEGDVDCLALGHQGAGRVQKLVARRGPGWSRLDFRFRLRLHDPSLRFRFFGFKYAFKKLNTPLRASAQDG